MVGQSQPASASHSSGGKFGLVSVTAVLTPKICSSSGMAPESRHSSSTGTSALQCGHQWARKTTIIGPPSPGTISNGVPS